MKVSEWMTRNVVAINEGDRVRSAVIALLENRIRHLPVLREGQVVGIISDRDLKQSLPTLNRGASRERYRAFMTNTRVREVMTRYPITCTPQTEVEDAVRKFCKERIGAMPVVEGEELVGIVTQTDMMRAFTEALRQNRVNKGAQDGKGQRDEWPTTAGRLHSVCQGGEES